MVTTDVRSNTGLRDLLVATIPGLEAEHVQTGGGCEALQITHPDRPARELLVTDADAALLLSPDGALAWGAFVGDYDTTDTVQESMLVELTAGEATALGVAEVVRRIIAAVSAWVRGTTVQQLADEVLVEIRADVDQHGWFKVDSFSDLHSHCDANGYLEGRCPVGESGDVDADLALTNAVTELVHAAIVRGEHRATYAAAAPSSPVVITATGEAASIRTARVSGHDMMNVGDLRALLEGLHDAVPVVVQLGPDDDRHVHTIGVPLPGGGGEWGCVTLMVGGSLDPRDI